MEFWETSEHSLIDRHRETKKICAEMAGRRTFRILTFSQQLLTFSQQYKPNLSNGLNCHLATEPKPFPKRRLSLCRTTQKMSVCQLKSPEGASKRILHTLLSQTVKSLIVY